MFLTLLTAAAVAQAPRYDVFLGMPKDMMEGVKITVAAMGDHWTPRASGTTKIGRDTLVMWAWPLKGNHGIGLQIYGPDGKFKTRLEDSNIPSARAVVCQDRFVVGGGNTLRVWDAARGYALVTKRTFTKLGQFALPSCQANVLTMLESTELNRWLVPSLRPVDVRLGLSAVAVQALDRSTMNTANQAHLISRALVTPGGDTVVAWARTAGYDPKGPRGMGMQVYRPDGTVKFWLKDSAVERAPVLCGRFLVAGDNTLRVWDTGNNYALVARRLLPAGGVRLGRELQCAGNAVTVTNSTVKLSLPDLTPVP